MHGAVPGEGGHHGGQQGAGGEQELRGRPVVQLLPAVWVQGEQIGALEFENGGVGGKCGANGKGEDKRKYFIGN